MSGICGVVNFDGAPVDTEALRGMAAALCWGHDRVHYRIDASLGFAYLSASPLSAATGERPPCRQDGVVVVTDSRLDNRGDLIRTLIAKDCLVDEKPDDATLIAAAHQCWKVNFHNHLQGAYSIAVWDGSKRCLILLRDRIGERGLYWHRTANSVLFASEPGPLLASGMAPRDYRLERILAHLLFARPEPSWSYFRGIHRLPEAHYLVNSKTGTALHRYWSLDDMPARRLARPAAAQELRRRLGVAVARRSAGETGVLLSGGLDSASVAAEAAILLDARGSTLHAYTWASARGDDIDERERSSRLVQRYSNIAEHPILADDLWPLSRYPDAYADPNDPTVNAYPDLSLTTIETARRHGVAVLMNGIGGDTVVGMLAPGSWLLARGQWRLFWRWFRRMRGGVRRPTPAWLNDRGRRLVREAGLDRLKTPWRAWISPRKARCFALSYPTQAIHLERFDRLSRRTGVRVTAPWHDVDLASFVASLSDGALDVAPPPKSLLRAAMAGRLPEEILVHPKPEISSSRLAFRGMSGMDSGSATPLFSFSQLDTLGFLDAIELSETYRTMGDKQRPEWWVIVTTEAWLRALSEFLTKYHSGFERHE